MAWAAPLGLALSTIPRCEPSPDVSHQMASLELERNKDKSRPGGTVKPGNEGKSQRTGGRRRVKKAGADFGAGPGGHQAQDSAVPMNSSGEQTVPPGM